MANPTNLPGDLVVPGNIRVSGSISPAITKANILAQAELQSFTVPMSRWREHDDYATVLDGTPVAANHLGLVGGTHATNAPSLQTDDFGENGAASHYYARGEIVLPWEYIAGSSVKIRLHAGMLTAVADQECTVDVLACKSDEDSTSSADLCATAASTDNMNSVAFGDIDFTITAATLSPGDILDVLIDVLADDNGTAVTKACIGSVQLLCDVR